MMLEHAVAYASQCIQVFACHHPVGNSCSCGKEGCRNVGKHPATPNGFKDATGDPVKLREMWKRLPEANIGTPTGYTNGFDVLDIDTKLDGFEALLALEAEHGRLPETRRARTGSGGEHILFTHTQGLLNNNNGKLGKGVDFKTEGGYIIAAPSRHISGGSYEWLNDAPIVPPPPWLVTKLRGIAVTNTAERIVDKNPNFWHEYICGTTDPPRHEVLLRVASHLLGSRSSVDPYLAAALVHAFNQQHCQPPKEVEEVDGIIRWVLKKRLNSRGR